MLKFKRRMNKLFSNRPKSQTLRTYASKWNAKANNLKYRMQVCRKSLIRRMRSWIIRVSKMKMRRISMRWIRRHLVNSNNLYSWFLRRNFCKIWRNSVYRRIWRSCSSNTNRTFMISKIEIQSCWKHKKISLHARLYPFRNKSGHSKRKLNVKIRYF